MAVAEISMAIAGARKAVQFIKAVAEAKGDFDQCIGKIHNFYNFYDTVREAEVKAQNGDYFQRNSPEAQALEEIQAAYQMEQMEEQMRFLIHYNMSPEHFKRMMRRRKEIRAQRLQKAKAKAERRRLLIDGLFIFACVVAAFSLIGYAASLIIGAKA
jgi:cation transport ATPase